MARVADGDEVRALVAVPETIRSHLSTLFCATPAGFAPVGAKPNIRQTNTANKMKDQKQSEYSAEKESQTNCAVLCNAWHDRKRTELLCVSVMKMMEGG